ncbi:Zinc finger CCHC-type [Trinorchestia longiramus]|nr:Zinc finger CCHC-type [Trinorchestia longiramus]
MHLEINCGIGTDTISSTADEAARRKFESCRDLALATIVLGVDQSQLYLLGDLTDPVEVWRKLQNTFQKKSWANKFRLKKKLFNRKLENGQNLQDHLKVCVELFEELDIIGDAMKEEERVIILLSSLPDRFSTLVTALEAHEKIPAWEVVTERLLNEERRQRGGPETSDSSEKLLVSFKRNQKLIKCFECGKEGHIKRQCRVYEERLKKENRTFQANKAVDARSSSTGETTMFTSGFSIGNVDCDSWIVDSGATQHMCNRQSEFLSYSDLSSPVRVEIDDGRALKVCHLRRSLQKKLSVFLAPFLKKKNMRIQKESWSSVVQLGTELLLIDLEDGVGVMQIKNELLLEQSAYTKALLSRFGIDKANSVATPVDINADPVTTSDEVEECDKDLYQNAVGSLCTKEIDLVYCPSNDMLADIFTKGLSAEKFSWLRRKLGVVFFEKHIQCEKEC